MLQLQPQRTILLRPAFLLTFPCYQNRDYLTEPLYREFISKLLRQLGEKLLFRINALTFTPRCLWLIITPFAPTTLEKIILQLRMKSGSYLRETYNLPTPLWETKPLVRQLLSREELRERKNYLKSLESLDLP